MKKMDKRCDSKEIKMPREMNKKKPMKKDKK